MDRFLWMQELSPRRCPPWPCPICHQGITVLTPNSVAFAETVQSVREHDAEAWDPEWVKHNFTAWAQCSNASCAQKFAIAGYGGVAPMPGDEETEWRWEEYFVPTTCVPMPDVFPIPRKCPAAVQIELRGAFSLFWAHPAACAGRIRVALECLLNHLGEPTRKKTSKGTFAQLSLHARIEAFAKREPTVGNQLMALKWLGNAGSHDSQINKPDLLDAFEIVEHALAEVIDRRSRRVAQLAKKLTRKHGRK